MSDEETTPQRDLPAIGTKVIKHFTNAAPMIGAVVPREKWELTDDLPPDTFIVDFSDGNGDWIGRFTVAEASTTEKVVHIDQSHADADSDVETENLTSNEGGCPQ